MAKRKGLLRRVRRLIQKKVFHSRRVINQDYFAEHFPDCIIHWTFGVPKVGSLEMGYGTIIPRDSYAINYHPDDVVRMRRYVGISNNTIILNGGEHELHRVATYPFGRRVVDGLILPQRKEGVVTDIGNDVWVGTRAIILGPVKIGDSAVVGAGAVVTRDVPPYSVVAGMPAKVVRMRASDDQIEKLLKIAWWDWPPETVRERVDDIMGPIQPFIDKYYSE
jgi:acetyltransferase-like isoleucine patch superfamily enzyme